MDLIHKHIYSDKYKFIYHEIQKCGTRTMLKHFIHNKKFDYEAVRVRGYAPIRDKDDYYKFTFVRNPWSRIVSCWLSKFVLYDNMLGDGMPGIRHEGLSKDISFDSFVDFVCNTPDNKADVHFKSMHCFVSPGTRIGKLESFSRDFTEILQDIGLPVFPIGRVNVTSRRGAPHWSEYYTHETREKIGDRYYEDIQTFGYSFKGDIE